MNTTKGWLAPTYINDVFLLLTADTGAEVTMMNSEVFKRYFPDTKLEPSTGNFTTASGDKMPVDGQFRANVQIGPVTIAFMMITIADVVGDGLLGLDYLTAADAWVGVREGKLHMKVDGHEVICQLRKEEYRMRKVARPSREATIEPLSHGVVPCTVENRGPPTVTVKGGFGKPTVSPGLVMETVWWPPEGI
eukprot:GHVU01190155.1.p1 GENE.GHVU01190155.1~~GHVU01190155.1.p1  ORF type:complete len:192 (+),score=14.10 GHVU01190155.1:1-576(+)